MCILIGALEEIIYVEQPPGYMNDKYPILCYIFDKPVYGLKQTPRAWYATLTNFFENV